MSLRVTHYGARGAVCFRAETHQALSWVWLGLSWGHCRSGSCRGHVEATCLLAGTRNSRMAAPWDTRHGHDDGRTRGHHTPQRLHRTPRRGGAGSWGLRGKGCVACVPPSWACTSVWLWTLGEPFMGDRGLVAHPDPQGGRSCIFPASVYNAFFKKAQRLLRAGKPPGFWTA